MPELDPTVSLRRAVASGGKLLVGKRNVGCIEPIAMRVAHVLLMSAISATGCFGRGPALQQPVGQTVVTSSPSTSPPPLAVPDTAPAEVERYLTGQSTGPCGMEQLPVVEFGFASSTLGEPQTRALQRLAGCLTAAPYDATSIVLVGYADVIGTVPANLALGLERAESVMAQLIEGGVSPGRVVVASAGELQRPHARRGLRAPRVEILIARGGPPRPNEVPIARGIDTEGLRLRRPPPVVGGGSPGPRVPPRWPPPMMRPPPPRR